MPARLVLWREDDRGRLPLVIALSVLFAGLLAIFFVVFSATRVDGDSMHPTLLNGDRVLVTKGYDVPSRGDVVSIRTTDGSTTSNIIKRVVALPGDTVEVVGDVAYVNGAISGAAPRAVIGSSTERWGSYTVAPGTVYVLGDNRPISLDSRLIGPVPLAAVRGQVVAIFSPVTRVGRID